MFIFDTCLNRCAQMVHGTNPKMVKIRRLWDIKLFYLNSDYGILIWTWLWKIICTNSLCLSIIMQLGNNSLSQRLPITWPKKWMWLNKKLFLRSLAHSLSHIFYLLFCSLLGIFSEDGLQCWAYHIPSVRIKSTLRNVYAIMSILVSEPWISRYWIQTAVTVCMKSHH